MKNNNFKLTLTIFTLLLTIGVYAQRGAGGGGRRGQGGGKGGGRVERPNASEILSKLDTNKDKVIDKTEASADEKGKISKDFDVIDTNSDDLIDLEELNDALNDRKKTKKVSAEKLIKEVDDNGDGLLNELEIAVKRKHELTEHFQVIDTNKDNELDLQELEVFYANKDNDEKPKRRKKN